MHRLFIGFIINRFGALTQVIIGVGSKQPKTSTCTMEQISAKKMAQKVSSLLKSQNPNYDYLRDLFRFVRENINIEVTTTLKRLPYVPTEDKMRLFYKSVWESRDIIPMLIVKVLLY